MKNILVFIFLLCSILPSTAQNTIINKTLSIKEAKIFRKGATVTLADEINFPQGKSTLKIHNLPSALDPNTIEIYAEKSIKLSGMRKTNLNNSAYSEIIDFFENRKIRWRDSIELLSHIDDLVDTEIRMIKSNTLASENTNIALTDIRSIQNLYHREMPKLFGKKIDIKKRIKNAQRKIEELNQAKKIQIDSLNRNNSILVLDVESNKSISSEILLKYYTDAAGWEPAYELRASTGSPTLQIIKKVKFYQNTGQDWKNTTLRLTNTDPQINQVMPLLQPHYITRPYPYLSSKREYGKNEEVSGVIMDRHGNPIIGANVVEIGNKTNATISNIDGQFVLHTNKKRTPILVSYIGYKSQKFIISGSGNRLVLDEEIMLDEVVVTGNSSNSGDVKTKEEYQNRSQINIYQEDSDFIVQYLLPDPINLKSTNNHTEEVIDIVEANAIYTYKAFPKLSTYAYLEAKIPEWQDYKLLNGEAQLFLDNTYKGNNYLNANSFTDTLLLSLGQDQAIQVSRELVKLDKKKTFWKNKVVEAKAYEIKVRNNKDNPVILIIKDQHPISDHEDVEIELKNSGGAEVDEKFGFLSWKTKIPPNSSYNTSFRYEIKYPPEIRIY